MKIEDYEDGFHLYDREGEVWRSRYEDAIVELAFHFRDFPKATDIYGRRLIKVEGRVYEYDRFLRTCARMVADNASNTKSDVFDGL